MGILQYATTSGLKRFYENLKPIAKNERKNRLSLFLDAVICYARYGSGFSDYLNYKFYKRTRDERKRYATIRTQDKFYEIVNPSEFKKTFTVKTNFMKTFSEYTKRDFVYPENDSLEKLEKFISENKLFMQKPIDGLAGHDVKKISADDIKDISNYYSFLKENRLFVDQYIIQHDDISAICSKSVNTVRVMTSTTSGKPEIIFACLRVGNGSADIDNFHGGGMGVLVDVDSGILVGKAIDKDLNCFESHPVSGIKYDGYKLPFWDEIKRIVCEASLIEKRIMLIGWDVAITPDGPIFVEANRRPGFDIIQVLFDRGRKDIIESELTKLNNRK